MDRRVGVTIVVLLAIVVSSALLMGCQRGDAQPNCVAKSVEMETKNGKTKYELDYTDGREITISAVTYNFYKNKRNFSYPCPVG